MKPFEFKVPECCNMFLSLAGVKCAMDEGVSPAVFSVLMLLCTLTRGQNLRMAS